MGPGTKLTSLIVIGSLALIFQRGVIETGITKKTVCISISMFGKFILIKKSIKNSTNGLIMFQAVC
jgi:hypothetical protein